MTDAIATLPAPSLDARAVIQRHSKSFSLASLLLAPVARGQAEALYAYCRRADDAIDLVSPAEAPARLQQLRQELEAIYAGRALPEPTLSEFQRLVFDLAIPRDYPEALLRGFELDAAGHHYETLADLLDYCWCVAGSVGAMMCHVLGVRRERAVVHGVHLGMAMQLSNICRDVAEDWQRGRLYLPSELTAGLKCQPNSGDLPHFHSASCARAVRALLAEAEVLYRSGDRGLPYLEFRARLAVGAARNVYSAIGHRLLDRDGDVLAGRAVVPGPLKLWHVARAGVSALALGIAAPLRSAQLPHSTVRFPEDVLPY